MERDIDIARERERTGHKLQGRAEPEMKGYTQIEGQSTQGSNK